MCIYIDNRNDNAYIVGNAHDNTNIGNAFKMCVLARNVQYGVHE